ncbi:MAG: hypothetical protein AB1921_07290 [Thermodesulfobacteriota bacterium]
MKIPRIQAFEFNDNPRVPRFLRDSIVEILGLGLRLGNVLAPVGPVFMEFCQRAGVDEVLDLCSGTGEPAAILVNTLKRAGFCPPTFYISDLFPNREAMERSVSRHPDKLVAVPEPVDATDVPERLDRSGRCIINAFHHFRPELGAAILADCVAKRRPVFLAEGFNRRPAGFFPLLIPLVLAHYLNPFFAKRDRGLKLFFTYLVPAVSLLGTWDAVVSFLRTRTPEELFEMTRPISRGYVWEAREVPYPAGGANTVFFGIPE